MTGRSHAPEAASDVEFTLDQRLCLSLYTASRAMTARYRVALGQLRLTSSHNLVMVLLLE